MESRMKRFAEVPVVWKPPEEAKHWKRKFIKHIEDKYNVKLDTYWDFHEWSVQHIPEFWTEVWDYSDIIYSKKFHQVIDLKIPLNENPKWFEGAKLNYAENLLRNRSDRVALITAGEDKEPKRITYAEVYEKSKLYAAAFRKFGLKKGDRVACYMSNREEPIFAMIGVTSIGAIWTGALPLLGTQAVLNRFVQMKPRILITIDRFQYKEEEHEMLHKVKVIAEGLPSLEKVIIVPSKEESKLKDISGIPKSCFLEDFLNLGFNKDGTVPEIYYEQVSLDHPVFVSFTSGTTGLPKALIHGSGILVAMKRDFILHPSGSEELVTLSMSPVGWATWVIYATYLSAGITVVAFEGFPFLLSPTYLWDLVDEFQIKSLFLTPSTLDELEKRGYVPTEKHNLSSLTAIISGGSVVKLQNYDFVYNKVKKGILFFSGYGSTEIMANSLVFDFTLPIYKGELTCPSGGTVMECLDESGNPVVGEVGDLVIARPIPSLPLGMWGDEDGSLFKQTYLSKFPGKFSLNDLAVINPITKGFTIYGRSDETIKQGEDRFGSSEIYNVVNKLDEIRDSLCVCQYSSSGKARAVLFVKMMPGYRLDDSFVQTLRSTIAKELTKAHVPNVILETPDIPYNLNGKKMEVIVKNIISKFPYNDDTVRNKECLDFYRLIPPYED